MKINLAKTFSLLDYDSLLKWKVSSRNFWKIKVNLQRLQDRVDIKNLIQKDPGAIKKLEDIFKKQINERSQNQQHIETEIL